MDIQIPNPVAHLRKLSPDTLIEGIPGINLGDFWQWAYSDILSNANRALFAEFIVGAALGVTQEEGAPPRIEWDETDIKYRGRKIEVKTSAYLQSWIQKGPSRIMFDIAPKRGWNSETNTSQASPVRVSDCYVFCMYTERNREQANMLNLTKWDFFIALTRTIDEKVGGQKSIGLSSLKKFATGPVKIHDFKDKLDELLDLNR